MSKNYYYTIPVDGKKITRKDDQLIIEEGFLHAVGRRPTGLEMEICLEILKPGTGESRRDFCQMLFCLNEFIYVE